MDKKVNDALNDEQNPYVPPKFMRIDPDKY